MHLGMREKIGVSVVFDNFITQILPYFFHCRSLSLQTAAGSFRSLQLETAVMSATCAAIPHRAAKKSTNNLHLPKTSVCFSGCPMGDKKISLVIDNRQKGHCWAIYDQLYSACMCLRNVGKVPPKGSIKVKMLLKAHPAWQSLMGDNRTASSGSWTVMFQRLVVEEGWSGSRDVERIWGSAEDESNSNLAPTLLE